MTTINAVIVEHQERIVAAWMSAVGQSPFARGLTRRELASTIPAYLQLLGRCAVDRPVELDGAQHRILDRHLSNRVRQGYTLDGILTEFTMLGRVLSREVDAIAAPDRPGAADITRVFAELYLTALAAANLFDQQVVDEHAPWHPERMLRQVVAPSVDRAEGPLSARGRLDDFLDIVVRVTGAQTAALFLLDVAGERLVLSGCRGGAGDALEAYVNALDRSALPGNIASAEGAPPALEASLNDLQLGDRLREDGIHSLLGVRLEEGHRLRGVLYIGIRVRRAFTGAEVARLEAMSRALWPLLDSLRLQAALSARHEDLAIEQEIREHMVSVLAQDLAVPLRGALRSAGAIWARVSGEDHRRAGQVIYELERVKVMVDGMIDVHRIRAGQPLELQLRLCDLVEVATAIADELRGRHGLKIVLQAAGRVEGVWDRDRLHLALHALMSNAMQHGPSDSSIRVTVTRSVNGAEVVVHDQGPAGSGRAIEVGVLVASGIAEAHGGRVCVDVDPACGTALRFMVPLDATSFVDPDPDRHDA